MVFTQQPVLYGELHNDLPGDDLTVELDRRSFGAFAFAEREDSVTHGRSCRRRGDVEGSARFDPGLGFEVVDHIAAASSSRRSRP